jgi:uncharacterized linocin/CFP29 family protein
MDNAQMDFMSRGMGQGNVAQYILSTGKMDSGRLRPFIGTDGRSYISIYNGSGDVAKPESYQTIPIQTNATLRRDEWKHLDDAIQPIAKARLGGIQDLIDKNLVFNLGNAMGPTVLEYHDISDSMEAAMTMDGVSRSPGDRPSFGTNYLPLPIIHVDYEINSRVLAASRSLGNPLDTTSAEQATRKVSEKLEELLFTSTSYTYGGGTIYGYLNSPNRNQVTLAAAWDASAKTAAAILADVIAIKQASITAKHYGPWALYIPTAYETVLDEDYNTTTPGTTIRERIMKIAGIETVKVIDTLTADNVVLVEMNSSTVRLIRGMGIQNVEWETEGKMVTKYKVMTIQVPQVRADQAGNSGIVHLAA